MYFVLIRTILGCRRARHRAHGKIHTYVLCYFFFIIFLLKKSHYFFHSHSLLCSMYFQQFYHIFFSRKIIIFSQNNKLVVSNGKVMANGIMFHSSDCQSFDRAAQHFQLSCQLLLSKAGARPCTRPTKL